MEYHMNYLRQWAIFQGRNKEVATTVEHSTPQVFTLPSSDQWSNGGR